MFFSILLLLLLSLAIESIYLLFSFSIDISNIFILSLSSLLSIDKIVSILPLDISIDISNSVFHELFTKSSFFN